MTKKADSKQIRANIANTRQAMLNAQKRSAPKFKHPERSKAERAAPAANTDQTTETSPAVEPDPSKA